MLNRIKIKWRGRRKYYAREIPLQYRQVGESRKEIMATSREDLARKYDQEIGRRSRGLVCAAGKKTLANFLEVEFLPFYKNEVEPQTWCDYRLHIESQIVPSIGDIRLDCLTTHHVDQWRLSLRNKTSERTGRALSDRTIDYALGVLRRALQFAVDWRYIAFNPAAAGARAARRRKKRRMSALRFLTPEQARRFLEAIRGDRFEALYLLALTSGLRQGELLGLKWSDVDPAACRLTINHALAHTKRKKGEPGERIMLKAPKTDESRRTIEIPQLAVAALVEHAKWQDEIRCAAGADWKENGYVFTSSSGTPLDRGNVLHRFQDILRRNGLPKVRFYDLRHTHASLLIAEGVHAKKIAERLGHSSIKLTMDTYGHLFEGSDRESADRMDRLFGKLADSHDEAHREGGKLVVFPMRISTRHADKNADKGPRAPISEPVND